MIRAGAGALAATIIAAAGCQSDMNNKDKPGMFQGMGHKSAQPVEGARMKSGDVQTLTKNWPEDSKKAAMTIAGKYGAPDEATESTLCWKNKGAWKRTIVYRDPVQHDFPMPHTDVLEQFVDYRVPPEKFSDLAAYDGSVIVERTKGEISARCDKEEMNILALNLAHDIVTGKRDVNDARAYYAKAAMDFKQGRKDPYVERLHFQPSPGSADPDRPAMQTGGRDRM
jgi:hypothetical protein